MRESRVRRRVWPRPSLTVDMGLGLGLARWVSAPKDERCAGALGAPSPAIRAAPCGHQLAR